MNAFGVLPLLRSKKEIDRALQTVEDLVLVLRFGREAECLELDDIVSVFRPGQRADGTADEDGAAACQDGPHLPRGYGYGSCVYGVFRHHYCARYALLFQRAAHQS
jgi:hypothetical protein